MQHDQLMTWTDVPILMYHSVEDGVHSRQYKHTYVTAAEFQWQMRSLKKRGLQPITFDELLAAKSEKRALPPKPVVLTFDDGYESLLRNAVPILSEFNFPYTVFLVSGLIGKSNEWVVPEGMTTFPLLSWDQIRLVQATGLAHFHPHTGTHPRLADVPIDVAVREMQESAQVLAGELGTRMNVFCYPYGSFNDQIMDAARDIGYDCAVTTEFGRVRQTDDPLRLPRISVYHIPPFSLDYGPAGINYWWRINTRRDTRPR